MSTQVDVDWFSGPGGWCEAARMLGLPPFVGFELDAAACATRAAAGHRTVRVDVSRFPMHQLAGRVRGGAGSPPCTTFSAAGSRGGILIMDLLAALISGLLAGTDTRDAAIAQAQEVLAAEPELDWAPEKIAKAARTSVLVAEPARFIAACHPEWVALEQVPAVLPLWQVYADGLRKMGYSAWCGKLNAANYGVPQTRERAILIASRVRQVSRPVPTHYDPRKGDQLWGTPWVSMAEALGWGADGRPAPVVTAGGTATGGAEPFGHRDRDMLASEQEAGRWALRRDRSHGRSSDHSAEAPAPAVTAGGSHTGPRMTWVLHTNRGQEPDGTRQTVDPSSAPAPALTAKSGGQWSVKSFRNNNNNNACTRSLDEPAGTLFFGARSNWAAWTVERPATTVQGDPRVGRPGHKDRDAGGESQFAVDSVRITVQEAAVLQSFRPDYPWQGTKTAQFTQVGNAFPPLLAVHVLAMATGISLADLDAGIRCRTRGGLPVRKPHARRVKLALVLAAHADPALDAFFPPLGRCGICRTPGLDQRHRVIDAIAGALSAGEPPEDVAEDLGVSLDAVRAVIEWDARWPGAWW